jgi:alkylhydroperoxidase family enzyme
MVKPARIYSRWRTASAPALGQGCPRRTQLTQRLNYDAATPAGVKAHGVVYDRIIHSGLPKALLDLVYLRVSQINGCAYCIDMRSRDLLK